MPCKRANTNSFALKFHERIYIVRATGSSVARACPCRALVAARGPYKHPAQLYNIPSPFHARSARCRVERRCYSALPSAFAFLCPGYIVGADRPRGQLVRDLVRPIGSSASAMCWYMFAKMSRRNCVLADRSRDHRAECVCIRGEK